MLVLTACCYLCLPARGGGDAPDRPRRRGGGPLARPLAVEHVLVGDRAPAAAVCGVRRAARGALRPQRLRRPSLLRFDAFTRVIYAAYRSSFDRTAAAVLSVLLVLITVAITVAEARAPAGQRAGPGGRGSRARGTVRLGGLRRPAAAAAAVIVGVALVFPIASLLYWFATGLSAGVDVAHLASERREHLLVLRPGAVLSTALAIPVGGASRRAIEDA